MGQRPLWAPWRIEYVKRAKDGECVFCASQAEQDGTAGSPIERGRRCFTLLNTFPYASGHVMIVPNRHVAGLDELDQEELLELMLLSRRATAAISRAMSADGFNIGLNIGEDAGAGLGEHLHLHVVPRWRGDTNFMPVIADTHVVSQALDATRAALLDALRQLD